MDVYGIILVSFKMLHINQGIDYYNIYIYIVF